MTTNTRLNAIAFCAALLFSASCQNSNNNSDKGETKDTAAAKAPLQPISMTPVGTSPEFQDAQLGMASVKAEKAGNDSAKVMFSFSVKNYELKQQTGDAGGKLCNNSDKGQHIHFILDNKPYKALYTPGDTVTLANNTEHYLMAFLSRSYHESLKSKGAALVYHFKIDEKGNLKKLDDPKTPMVFYSRPKGDYIGKDTTNVLFDFYVWNTTLAADGNKVKAQIHTENGGDTSITITDWRSNFLHNLGTGKSTITLTLVDKDGKNIEGTNTSVSRDFHLAAQEPMK